MSGKRKHKSGYQKHHEKKEREARRVVVSQSIKTFLKTGPSLNSARRSDVGPPSRGLTTYRRDRKGPVLRGLGGSRRRGPRRPDPWTRKLALGTWNVTSLAGK
ncbi:hypothetical protein PO909_002745 [Leuciscus waleckii]